MTEVTTFRPKGNYYWAAAALLIDALYVVQLLLYPDGENLWLGLGFALAAAVASYLLWLRPKLELRETDLRVVNPTATAVISYSDIVSLETKWSLLIVHSAGSTRVWVAPANGRLGWSTGRQVAYRDPFDRIATADPDGGDVIPSSRSVNSDSGLAALLIQRRLDELNLH